MYSCDLDSLVWAKHSAASSLSAPSPRFGQVGIAARPPTRQGMAAGPDGRLYVLGGTDGHNFFDDLFRFDPAPCSWERIRPRGDPPCSRYRSRPAGLTPSYRHTVLLCDNAFVVIGGGWPDPEHALLDHVRALLAGPDP
jgi:hypothetical protein